MDNLFSTIQQSFNNATKSNVATKSNDKALLLERQQQSQQQINDLLEKSTEALMCGPSCQKKKVTDELKQKYLDAQTNIQTAPINLEQTKKNYYIYSEGRPYYDDMKETELKVKSEQLTELLANNFNDEVASANTMNAYLNTALINSQYTKDLLNEYFEKNKILKLKLGEGRGDVLTNDRKTFYELDALNTLQSWHKLMWYIYYLFVLILAMSFIFYPNSLSVVLKVLIVVVFIFYPYYIGRLVSWLYNLCLSIINGSSKNVYNNL